MSCFLRIVCTLMGIGLSVINEQQRIELLGYNRAELDSIDYD